MVTNIIRFWCYTILSTCTNNNSINLLCVNFCNKLNFDDHIEDLFYYEQFEHFSSNLAVYTVLIEWVMFWLVCLQSIPYPIPILSLEAGIGIDITDCNEFLYRKSNFIYSFIFKFCLLLTILLTDILCRMMYQINKYLILV